MAEVTSGPTQDTLNWFPCKNAGALVIPAHGICQIDAPDGAELRDERRLILLVKQPDKLGFTSSVMVNGPIPIQPGQDGVVTDGRIVVAAYNKSFETPAKGEIWGPQKDSSYVRRHIPGGRVLRDGEKGRVILLRYEHYDIWGKLTAELDGGETAECKLMYADPNNPTILQEVEPDEDDPFRFDVSELTGDEFEGLSEDDIVIARYDETFGGYILRGWVC